MYNILGVGQDYYLGANFEYDMYPVPGVTFIGNLDHPPANINRNIDDAQHCNATSIDAPGLSSSPYCGNGILDSNYCTVPCESCDAGQCASAGGQWINYEECDSEFWSYACSQEPPNINPSLPAFQTVGDQEWWHEQTVGCQPRGAIDPVTGNLIECTWYRPDPAFTAVQCGGYCGDGTVQSYYENCDGSNMPAGDYHCANSGATPYCGVGCQVVCNEGGNIYPAAICGDGIWSEGVEQCDPSANPRGLDGWDCSQGGSISCSNSCERVCTAGVPYEGICGDGIRDIGYCSVPCPSCDAATSPLQRFINCQADGGVWYDTEVCDYADYSAPSPENSSSWGTYGCTTQCTWDGQYCGDGVLQYDFQELCDWNGSYTTPEPLFSDEYNQYLCRDSGTYIANDLSLHEACTPTLGGYCGDGNIQGTYGEDCDPGTPWANPPIPSNPAPLSTLQATDADHQYVCDADCVGFTGGYCGDGDTNEFYEVCDGADYPTRPTPAQSNINNTYTCADDCSGGAVGGGYCGDGYTNQIYYEGCDWGIPEDQSYWPWPRGTSISNFSSPNNQYVCSSCINSGGYCGNGIVDGYCTQNCSNFYDGTYHSQLNCSRAECADVGGTFTAYEQCDSGFDPAYVIEKNVDLVYVFDMSGSMVGDAAALCNSTQAVASNLDTEGIDYRISIMVLGDSDGVVSLTPGTEDDIATLFDDTTSPNPDYLTWRNAAEDVFTALVTNCPLFTQSANYPDVYYKSFYDNATNNINNGVSVDGDTYYTGGLACNSDYDWAGRLENWGYAANRIAQDYNWLPGYQRIVAPVSDEAAYCGGNTGLSNNENYDYTTLPDVLVDLVYNARAISPMVHVSPVLLRHDSWLAPVGQAIANDTGGLFTNSTSDWANQTTEIINATFCDGIGDGHMDCTLGSLAPPPCGADGEFCCSYNTCDAGLACTSGTCSVPPPPPCGANGEACCTPSYSCDVGQTCINNICETEPPGVAICDHNGNGIRNLEDANRFNLCYQNFDVNGDGIWNLTDTIIYENRYLDNDWCYTSFVCDPTNITCGEPGQPCCEGWACDDGTFTSCVSGVCNY